MEETEPCRRKPADGGRRTSVLKKTQSNNCLARAWLAPAVVFPALCGMALSALLGACSFQASMHAGGESKTAANEPAPAAAEPAPAGEAPSAETPAAPAKANVKVKGAKLEPPGGIIFQANDATFQPGAGSEAVLGEIKAYLDQNPRVTRLRIEGHTNNSRPPEQSLALSGQRAVAVKQWLLSNGINPGRLLAVGFGETQPIANNSDPAGAAQNERIQFRIAELDGKPYLGSDPLAGGTEFP
jgi:OOP family OmpA-OmpF porin